MRAKLQQKIESASEEEITMSTTIASNQNVIIPSPRKTFKIGGARDIKIATKRMIEELMNDDTNTDKVAKARILNSLVNQYYKSDEYIVVKQHLAKIKKQAKDA